MAGLFARFVAALDRRQRVILAILVVWLLALIVPEARAKFFWHDEVYTILVSRLSLVNMWRAYLDGIDLQPPLNTLITHVIASLAGVGPILTRLPAMTGFVAAMVLVFVTVRRKTNTVAAIASALILAVTPAHMYAKEARGYGLTLGLFALALYGWSEAAAGRRPRRNWTLVAIALGLSIWAHYYAVLAAVPIVMGEAVRQLTRRRFDWRGWGALAGGALLVVPLLPLIRMSAGHRGHFWASTDVSLAEIDEFLYGELRLYPYVIGALAVLALAEVGRRAWWREWPRRLAPEDVAAIAGCLLIPLAGLLLARWAQAITPRYLVFATVGFAYAIPQIIWWLTPANGVGEILAAGTLVWSLGATTVSRVQEPPKPYNPFTSRPVLADWIKGGEPIVIGGGVEYLEVWYAIPDAAKPRAIHLADLEGQLREHNSDTVDRNYLALARWTPLPVVPLPEFVRTHRRFWMYSFGTDWSEGTLRLLHARLIDHGRERDGSGVLYEVIMPNP